MVQSNIDWNPKNYKVGVAKKTKYKKLENIEGKKTLQKVLASTDRKKGFLKFTKLPLDVNLEDPSQQAKIYREARELIKIQHPNIIRVRDVFIMEKLEFVTCFEWVEGMKLSDWLKEKHTEDEVMEIFVQVAVAYKHLHDKDIMHKSISTDNIMVKQVAQDKSIAKVVNFSELRSMASNTSITARDRDKDIYASPDIINPSTTGAPSYTFSDDMWGLGVLLYKMATGGEDPFDFDNSDAIDGDSLKEKANSTKGFTKGKDFSADMAKMISGMCTVEPTDRMKIGAVCDHLQDRVNAYVKSEHFKAEWEDNCNGRMLLDDQYKMHQATLTEDQIENEKEALIKTIAP